MIVLYSVCTLNAWNSSLIRSKKETALAAATRHSTTAILLIVSADKGALLLLYYSHTKVILLLCSDSKMISFNIYKYTQVFTYYCRSVFSHDLWRTSSNYRFYGNKKWFLNAFYVSSTKIVKLRVLMSEPIKE